MNDEEAFLAERLAWRFRKSGGNSTRARVFADLEIVVQTGLLEFVPLDEGELAVLARVMLLRWKLRTAIRNHDGNAAKALLARGAPIDLSWWERWPWSQAWTPLLIAVFAGLHEIVALLLEYGANVNAQAPRSGTPLAVACNRSDLAMVEMLIAAGADPNLGPPEHSSGIEEAAFHNRLDMVDLLLAHGADPNIVLRRPLISLEKIRGRVLQRLIDAGGQSTPEIQELMRIWP